MKKRKGLRFAEILLSGILAFSFPNFIHAEEQTSKPKVMDNFDYASHRKGYEGKIFNYNLLSNAVISQSDKKGVNIKPIWFYDIDNDGKFGKAEKDAIKRGIPIFMHPAFNEIANAEVRKFLEIASEYSSLSEKLKQEEKNSQIYQKRISELEAKLIEYESKLLEKEKYEPKETEKRNEISLLTEVNNNNGGALGLRFTPFENKKIGFGTLVNISFPSDKTIDSYIDSLSSGRTACGIIKETNANSIGISAELQYGPLFVGGGINYQNWLTNTSEQILDSSGNTIKSNTNSVSNEKVFRKIYCGTEFPLSDMWKLGASIGYDEKNGVYFGLRNTFRLNNKQK
jgi:hypothetical protein